MATTADRLRRKLRGGLEGESDARRIRDKFMQSKDPGEPNIYMGGLNTRLTLEGRYPTVGDDYGGMGAIRDSIISEIPTGDPERRLATIRLNTQIGQENAERSGKIAGREYALKGGAGKPVRTATEAVKSDKLFRESIYGSLPVGSDELAEGRDGTTTEPVEKRRPGGLSPKFTQELARISARAGERREDIASGGINKGIGQIPSGQELRRLNLKYKGPEGLIKQADSPDQKKNLLREFNALRIGSTTPFLEQKQRTRTYTPFKALGVDDPSQIATIRQTNPAAFAGFNKIKAAYAFANEEDAASFRREYESRRAEVEDIVRRQAESLSKDKALTVRGKTAAIQGQEQRNVFAVKEEARQEQASDLQLENFFRTHETMERREITRKAERKEDIARREKEIEAARLDEETQREEAKARYWNTVNKQSEQFEQTRKDRQAAQKSLDQSRADINRRAAFRSAFSGSRMLADTTIATQKQAIAGLESTLKGEREAIKIASFTMAKLAALSKAPGFDANAPYSETASGEPISYQSAYDAAKAIKADAEGRIPEWQRQIDAAKDLATKAATELKEIADAEADFLEDDPDVDTRTVEQVGEDFSRQRIDRQIAISQQPNYKGTKLNISDAEFALIFNSMLREEKELPIDKGNPEAKKKRVAAKMKTKYKGYFK